MVRAHIVKNRASGNNLSWVDLLVAEIIMLFDMFEINGICDASMLI